MRLWNFAASDPSFWAHQLTDSQWISTDYNDWLIDLIPPLCIRPVNKLATLSFRLLSPQKIRAALCFCDVTKGTTASLMWLVKLPHCFPVLVPSTQTLQAQPKAKRQAFSWNGVNDTGLSVKCQTFWRSSSDECLSKLFIFKTLKQ